MRIGWENDLRSMFDSHEIVGAYRLEDEELVGTSHTVRKCAMIILLINQCSVSDGGVFMVSTPFSVDSEVKK